MIDVVFDLPFKTIGWALVHLLWISTLFLGGVTVVLKMLNQFNARIRYNIGMGSLLLLPLIPILLFVEHRGILPPLGMADWGSTSAGAWGGEPLIHGLPKVTGWNLGSLEPSLYYWLGVAWLLVAMTGVVYYLISMLREQLICYRKPRLKNPEVSSQIRGLAEELGVTCTIRLRLSSFRDGPAVAGIYNPILLIPDTLLKEYNPEEQKAIFLHELMHIKRRDCLYGLLQKFIQSLFFFQPLVWRLNRELNLEREHICDQKVTEITRDTYSYGKSLAKLLLQTQAALTHSVNIAEHPVLKRIRKLGNKNQKVVRPGPKLLKSGIALAIMTVTIFCTLWNAYHMHPDHNHELNQSKETVAKIAE